MNADTWKKLRKIDVLIKKNASDWFQQMKSHLCDEKQWKIIREVIIKQERETAEAAAQISEMMSLSESAVWKEILESAVSEALQMLTDDKDWNAKKWKMISTITALLKSLDRHTIRKCKYAENIWTYLTEFYKQSDQTAQMVALKKLITWKMNPNHTIKEASQEISFITDQVH